MKNLLLILTVVFFGLNGFAQNSFSLQYEGEALLQDQVIDFECTIGNGANAFHNLLVINNSASVKSVKAKKVHIDIVEGSENFFCWGLCFTPDTFISPVAQDIEGNGGSYDGFFGDYDPKDNKGITSVRYVFFDDTHPSDSISFVINYDYLSAVTELPTGSFNLYPSPARTTVHFDLDQVFGKVNIEVYNLLGKKIKDITTEGSVVSSMSVEDMENGIYFVKILQKNEVIETKKLVVKH